MHERLTSSAYDYSGWANGWGNAYDDSHAILVAGGYHTTPKIQKYWENGILSYELLGTLGHTGNNNNALVRYWIPGLIPKEGGSFWW